MESVRRRIVLVSGPPAAGKSTLARPLAAALGWPLLAKDDFKEALFDAEGADAGDAAQSRRLSDAAIAALWSAAAALPEVVIDANVRGGTARIAAFDTLADADVVEVHLDGERDELARRYAARSRHPAHPPTVPPDFASLDYGPLFPSRCLWLDAGCAHDIDRIAAWVRIAVEEAQSNRA